MTSDNVLYNYTESIEEYAHFFNKLLRYFPDDPTLQKDKVQLLEAINTGKTKARHIGYGNMQVNTTFE